MGDIKFLEELEAIIASRIKDQPEGSYVSKMAKKGLDQVLKKIGEESAEVIMAAKGGKKEEVIHEAADLIFHLMMVLALQDVSLGEVVDQLRSRHKK